MMKRILAGAAAAGFAATLLASGSASAASCPTGAQTAVTPANTIKGGIPPLGSTVYGAQVGTGGYLGITGGTGYIEVGGSSSGAYARGSATGQPVNGEIIAGPGAQKVCVANTTVK